MNEIDYEGKTYLNNVNNFNRIYNVFYKNELEKLRKNEMIE